MIKRIALFLLVAVLVALLTLAAAAQTNVAIKGVCKDENGKPIADAIVELANLDNGSKLTVKTNKHGEYYFLSPTAGSYKITLTAADGKSLAYADHVPIMPGNENVINFNLGKQTTAASKDSGLTEEQRKENEKINQQNEKINQENAKIKKDNEKIAGLNALMQQAAQQEKNQQYDAAVATMEQAAAQDQTHDIVYSSLADAYVQDKKFPEAETAYTKAIALAAANSKFLAGYHSGLALALVQQGKIEPSMDECGKTAQLDPKQAGQCYYNEGAILTNLGNGDAANQAFDKAIAADPTRAEAYYQKGINLLAKATLGKDNKMIPAPGTAEAFNKYLELAPDGKYAQSAKELLDSIGASIQASYGTQKKSGKK